MTKIMSATATKAIRVVIGFTVFTALCMRYYPDIILTPVIFTNEWTSLKVYAFLVSFYLVIIGFEIFGAFLILPFETIYAYYIKKDPIVIENIAKMKESLLKIWRVIDV